MTDRFKRPDLAAKPTLARASHTLLVQATSKEAHVLDVGHGMDHKTMQTTDLADHLADLISRVERGTVTIFLNIDRGGTAIVVPPKVPPIDPRAPGGHDLLSKMVNLTNEGIEALAIAERLKLMP